MVSKGKYHMRDLSELRTEAKYVLNDSEAIDILSDLRKHVYSVEDSVGLRSFFEIHGIINILNKSIAKREIREDVRKLMHLMEKKKKKIRAPILRSGRRSGMLCPYCDVFMKGTKQEMGGGRIQRGTYTKSWELVCPKCGFVKGDKEGFWASHRLKPKGMGMVVVKKS